MSLYSGNKKPASMYFGNKAVAAVYRGNNLVWQRVVKQLQYGLMYAQCVVFIPTQDITLSSLSVFGQYASSSGSVRYRILNECGMCIAYCDSHSNSNESTIYGLTGYLNTANNFGSITLYANNKYYINVKGANYNDNKSAASYVGLTTSYKNFPNIGNINGVSSSTAWQHECDGSASTFAEICQKKADAYFIWTGAGMNNSMAPSESGQGNPYPYLLHRDMSHVTKVFTDSDFNQGNDMARYAFIYYTMGNVPGREFVMNVGDNFGQGFDVGGTRVFANCKHKIYTLTGNMANNHITSMTPVDNEPSSLSLGDIYYKSSQKTWGSISSEAVVAWNGSAWEIATAISSEFAVDSTYDATNYVSRIDDNNAKDFNLVSETTGTKYYLQINGTEV